MKNLRSNHAAGVRVGIGGEQGGERDGCRWCHGEFPGASRPFWLGRRRKRAVEGPNGGRWGNVREPEQLDSAKRQRSLFCR